MEYLKIRNWEKWQTYRKDRGQPPWIKIHRCLMRDPEWVSLTDAERGQLVAMWLLAADKGGVIPASQEMIQKLCFLETLPDINKFTDLGFIENGWRQGGVKVASSGSQHDQPKAETEKIRREKKQKVTKVTMSTCGCIFCLHQTYCQVMRRNPNKYKLTPEKRKKIKTRLKDSTPKEIHDAILACKASNHHMGNNDDNQLYNDLLKNIIPSREKVEWWLERKPQQPKAPPGGFEL